MLNGVALAATKTPNPDCTFDLQAASRCFWWLLAAPPTISASRSDCRNITSTRLILEAPGKDEGHVGGALTGTEEFILQRIRFLDPRGQTHAQGEGRTSKKGDLETTSPPFPGLGTGKTASHQLAQPSTATRTCSAKVDSETATLHTLRKQGMSVIQRTTAPLVMLVYMYSFVFDSCFLVVTICSCA